MNFCRTFSSRTGRCLRRPRDSRHLNFLYGRHVRGPLDVFREAWTEEGCGFEDDKNVLSYITEVRDRLAEMADLDPGKCGNGAANAKEVL